MADFSSTHRPLLLQQQPSPDLNGSWGAFLIGTCIGAFLNVFSLILGYKYFSLYPTDARFLRTLVLVVLPLDLFQTIINVHACYWHLVPNHANPNTLILENWSFIAFGPVSTLIVVLCQGFYAHRVFLLGGHYRWVAVFAVIGMVALMGIDIALTVESVILPNLLAFRPITWMPMSMYGAAMTTDVILTCAIVFMLWRKRRMGRKAAHTVVASIIAYTVSSGVLFTMIGVLSFIYSLIRPGNLIFCAIMALGVEVYVISMLSAIISRKDFAARLLEDDGMSMFKTSQSQEHRQFQDPRSLGGISIAFAPVTTEISVIELGVTTSGPTSPQEEPDPKNRCH